MDRAEDLQQLQRYRLAGVLFMLLIIGAFPLYWQFEPSRMATARAEVRSVNVRLGATLYADHCASCHGEAGRGGGTGPTLAAGEFLGAVTDTQLRWLVAAGSPGTRMPAYDMAFGGPLSAQALDRLVVFLRSLEPTAASVPCWRDGDAIPPRDAFDALAENQVVPCASRLADAGLASMAPGQIYQEQCADCHGVDGEGSEIAGPLKPLPAPYADDLDALLKITRDGVDETSMLGFSLAQDGPLTDEEIVALSRWLQSSDWHGTAREDG
jgi:mono/diheme cytochrome c family protein